MTGVDWVLLVLLVILIVLAMALACCLERLRGSGDGARLIAAERERQREDEAWAPTCALLGHRADDLAYAAVSYALPPLARSLWDGLPAQWPWSAAEWQPADRKTDLIRAGAYIAAELDRMVLAERQALQRAQTFNSDPHAV